MYMTTNEMLIGEYGDRQNWMSPDTYFALYRFNKNCWFVEGATNEGVRQFRFGRKRDAIAFINEHLNGKEEQQ